jgi:hypothetical protein
MILYNWNAKRSGAAISITGVDVAGIERTLTGIASIGPNPSSHPRSVIAFGSDSAVHELAIEPRP